MNRTRWYRVPELVIPSVADCARCSRPFQMGEVALRVDQDAALCQPCIGGGE